MVGKQFLGFVELLQQAVLTACDNCLTKLLSVLLTAYCLTKLLSVLLTAYCLTKLLSVLLELFRVGKQFSWFVELLRPPYFRRN